MIWDGLGKAWQKANKEAAEARAAREAKNKNIVIIQVFLNEGKNK